MRRKIFLPAILITLILLACNCKALSLPILASTATPAEAPSTAYPITATPLPPPSIATSVAPFNISWDDRSFFRERLTSSYQDVLNHLPGASIYHLAFSLSNPPTSINGVEEVRYTNQEHVALTEVDFAIYSEILGGSIKINKALLEGQSVTPTFSKGLMRIPLTKPLEPDQNVIFFIDFSITVPTLGGDLYYGIFGYNNEILSLAHAYPTILVYNDQGWNNQTPDLDGDPLFSDTSFYLVSIDAPDDLNLVASGVELNHQETKGRQKALFADGPARDFYLAASKNFSKQSEKIGETTFNSYAPASLNQEAKAALKTAEVAIEDFSRRYAPYPYTEFDIVPIVTSAGGVEFPGLTAVAENAYNQGGFLEVVVAHEVAHQWFYNMVGNETQMQPWLDESLAQFATCQYYFDKDGTQAEQSCLDSMKARWDAGNDQKIPIGEPVSDYTNDSYGVIIYGRGPLFFQALREKIGQNTFDSLMRDYTTSFAWGIATTDSFKNLAEQHCNCDLSPLFTEWVYP